MSCCEIQQRRNRSVNDYIHEDEIRKALMGNDTARAETSLADGMDSNWPTSTPAAATLTAGNNQEDLDWVLSNFDPESTEVQSMKEELKRLQTLKDYLILDSEREETFERITSLAARLFRVPIALISLVDLGRQWFLSNRGLGDVRETPRRNSFCAHVILNRQAMIVVTDASKDFRFKNNPLVTGPPNIRFYAGASLISPEGYKLGTFCVISDTPRPGGITEDQKATLKDLADMTVKAIVDRRHHFENQGTPGQTIACAAHDIMTPLMGVQLPLSLLAEDQDIQDKLSSQQLELLSTAVTCADWMTRICEMAIDAARKDRSGNTPSSQIPKYAPVGTNLSDLVKSIQIIMDPIPKLVPLVVTLDSSSPQFIACNDVKLFRSALNLLSDAVERTKQGFVRMSIFKNKSNQLVFQCEDTGPDFEVEEYPYLFKPKQSLGGTFRLGLSSVASLINSVRGTYGFQPRSVSADGEACVRDAFGQRLQGSIFWFSVPIVELREMDTSLGCEKPTALITSRGALCSGLKNPIATGIRRTRSNSTVSDNNVSILDTPRRVASMNSILNQQKKPHCFFRRCGSGNSIFSRMSVRDPLVATSDSERTLNADFGASLNHAYYETSVTPHRNRGALNRKIPSVANQSLLKLAVARNNTNRKKNGFSASHDDAMTGISSMNITSTANAGPLLGGTNRVAISVKANHRSRRALVIEDTALVRKSLARAFNKLGFEVTEAVNGLEGLEALKKTLFDLTLCDFLMPVMDGMDCVKQYRAWESENRSWFRQLIVGISAHANVNDRGQGIEGGMDAFKPKPITLKTLTELHKSEEVSDRTKVLDQLEGFGGERSHAKPVVHIVPPVDVTMAPAPVVSADSKANGFRNKDFGISACRSRENDKAAECRVSPKKRKTGDEEDEPPNRVCLIASDSTTSRSSNVLSMLQANKWNAVIVDGSEEALRLLQIRNWDAVLIDDDLPKDGGAACIREFRMWEEQNRMNGQRNIFSICCGDIPSPLDPNSFVQPPIGFDGALRKPVEWKELQYMIEAGYKDHLDIVVR